MKIKAYWGLCAVSTTIILAAGCSGAPGGTNTGNGSCVFPACKTSLIADADDGKQYFGAVTVSRYPFSDGSLDLGVIGERRRQTDAGCYGEGAILQFLTTLSAKQMTRDELGQLHLTALATGSPGASVDLTLTADRNVSGTMIEPHSEPNEPEMFSVHGRVSVVCEAGETHMNAPLADGTMLALECGVEPDLEALSCNDTIDTRPVPAARPLVRTMRRLR